MAQPADEEYVDDFEGDGEQYDDEDGQLHPEEEHAGEDASGDIDAQGEDGDVEDEEDDEPADEGQEEEELEEEEEEEEEEEAEQAEPWAGLSRLPERADILSTLASYRQETRKSSLTVLLLGKTGVGKSSTVNTLLGENRARVTTFKLQADADATQSIIKAVQTGPADEEFKAADNFRIRIIDTQGVEDSEAGDMVSYAGLQRIAEDIRGQPIDVVLYCDRLDMYRVEPLDHAAFKAISDVFGRRIWQKTLLLFTHGGMQQFPPRSDFDSFASRRAGSVRHSIRTLLSRPRLEAVIVENSETCTVNDRKYRITPDEVEFVPDLVTMLCQKASQGRPYKYHPRLTRNPNHRFRWLVPALAVGQYFLYNKFLVPLLEEAARADKAEDELQYKRAAAVRRKLGVHPPLRPPKDMIRVDV